ncbi:DUF3786 domain-containing protein [Thermosulfuriphilus sp.]
MPTALEIFKTLPRTNCRECGQASCLAFATAVASGVADPRACPYFEVEKFPDLLEGKEPHDQLLKILEYVRSEVTDLDLSQTALKVGGTFDEGWLSFPYLGEVVRIRPDQIETASGYRLDPRDQILLYNYLRFAKGDSPSGQFVGLEAFPNSVAKVATLRRYAEDPLAAAFSGVKSSLERVLKRIYAEDWPGAQADISVLVPALPRVPLVVLFWDRDEEEGFSARAKILFNQTASSYLDLESLVFLAERLSERLRELA